jgi:CBS domain-containing protein
MDRYRIRHVPIVDMQGNYVGLTSHRDMLSATISQLADLDQETQREIDAGIPLREIMSTQTATLAPDDSIREAAETLLNNKFGCMPVLEGSELVGILTEADFLKLTINLMEALNEND